MVDAKDRMRDNVSEPFDRVCGRFTQYYIWAHGAGLEFSISLQHLPNDGVDTVVPAFEHINWVSG
jgi:hypothetical protein